MIEETTATVPCPECGEPYAQRRIEVDGKPMIANRRCPQCIQLDEDRERDRRAAWEAERARREREERQLSRERRAHWCLEQLAVPALYDGVSLDTWELHGTEEDQRRQQRMRSAGLRYLEEWPNPSHRILVLRGAPGTGKGHWAWSVAQALAAHGEAVQVVKLSNLIRELRRSWRSKDAESEEATLAKYRSLDLLVIDEVSRHAFYGEQIHQHLYDVIDDRLEHLRPTIITSNEEHESLAEILRPALWSRVHGNGGVLEFGTADYRRRARVA